MEWMMILFSDTVSDTLVSEAVFVPSCGTLLTDLMLLPLTHYLTME